MSLVNEVGGGLDGFSQLRAGMASGRKPGILVALDFEFVEVEAVDTRFFESFSPLNHLVHYGGGLASDERPGRKGADR